MSFFTDTVESNCFRCNNLVSHSNDVTHPVGRNSHFYQTKHQTKHRSKKTHTAHPECLIKYFSQHHSDSVKCSFEGCSEQITKHQVNGYKHTIAQRVKKYQGGCLVLGTMLTVASRMWMTPRDPGLREAFVETVIGVAGVQSVLYAGLSDLNDVVDETTLDATVHAAVALLASDIFGNGFGILALGALALNARHQLKEKKEVRILFAGRFLGVVIGETASFLKVVEIWGMVFGAMITTAMLGTFVGRRFAKH